MQRDVNAADRVFDRCQGVVTDPDVIFEPDEDFHASISMEEVRDRLHRVVDKLYANDA